MSSEDLKGVIGESHEDGFPIVWKFVDELPDQSILQSLPHLVVIAWNYDGSSNNGMPPNDILEQMKDLEAEIDEKIARDTFLKHAYSKTGNNIKELVYYAHDTDLFIDELNSALASHPRYPLDISFYEDADWSEFKHILSLFRK